MKDDRIIGMVREGRFHEVLSEYGEEVPEEAGSSPEALNAYAVAMFAKAAGDRDAGAGYKAIELLKEAAGQGSSAARTNLDRATSYMEAYEAFVRDEKEAEDDFIEASLRFRQDMERYRKAKETFETEFRDYSKRIRRYRKKTTYQQ